MGTGAQQQRRPPRGQPRKDWKDCTRRGYTQERGWSRNAGSRRAEPTREKIQAPGLTFTARGSNKPYRKKQVKMSTRKRKRGRAGRGLARAAARLTRKRQKAALLKITTYNVRSLSLKGANGYGRDEVVLHKAAANNIAVVGIQETRRPGRTVSLAAGFRVFYSGSTQGGQHGVALAVKESICKTSKFTREDVNERLMSMRFEMSGQHQAVNFVVGYALTEPSDSEKKRAFWHLLDSLVQRIPNKGCLFVLMGANARTGEKREGERTEDDGVLGAYGRDELNNNDKRLLNFATDNKLAVTNTFFSTRKGGISHTYNGVIGYRAGDFKRIDYILTRQAHRPRVHNVEVHPQPNRPIKADLDHIVVFCRRGPWGTICPQPSCTADTATPVIRQKPAEDEIPPGARDPEIR